MSDDGMIKWLVCNRLNFIFILLYITILMVNCPSEMLTSNIVWAIVGIISFVVLLNSNAYIVNIKIWQVIILNIIISIGLMGNIMLIYPISVGVHDVTKIIGFFLFFICCTPISLTFLFVPGLIQGKLKYFFLVQKGTNYYRIHFLIYFIETLVFGLILMYAFNPCIVSFDAGYSVAEALGLRPISEYRGITYALFYRFLLSIHKSEQFLCTVQIVLFGGIFALVLSYLEREFNMRFLALQICYGLFLALPSNMMLLVTINKDIYYAMGLVLLTFSLLYLSKKNDGYWGNILLALSMFLTFTIRQSGMIVVIFVALVGSYLFFKKSKCVLITMGISLFLGIIFTVSMPNILKSNSQEIEMTPWGMGRVALFQDILGVYYAGGALSDDTISLINYSVGDDIGYEEVYSPYWAYHTDYYEQIGDIHLFSFIKCYIDTLFKNPVLMVKSIMCRIDMLWDFRPGIGVIEQGQWKIADHGGDWSHLFKARKENFLTDIINRIGDKTKNYPFKEVVWRVAEWNFALTLIFIFLLKDNKKYLIIFLPLLGYFISYIITLGWSTYRYYWANELMAFIIILVSIGALYCSPPNKCIEADDREKAKRDFHGML